MKRVDLIRHLERCGCEFFRQGGNHTVYINRSGLATAAWSHPRAVVLVLTGNPDASVRPVQHARSFLADLGVPLVVWTAGGAAPETAGQWGGGRSVKTLGEFRAAVRALDAVGRSEE